MKAVILVGGEGTRLHPLTINVPKAMVPILNKPCLEYLIRYLREHNITDIILTTSYLPDRIHSYLGDGDKLDVHLTYLVEEQPLGTAGAVKNAEALLDETFFVVNGDILTGIDLTTMMRQHQKTRPRVSIALTPVDDPTIYGVVETDGRGMVKRFVEKPSPEQVTTNMINAGIYILEPEVLADIPPSIPSMFERNLFPLLLERDEPILSYPADTYWIDIGTPEKYLKVQHDLLLNKAPSLSIYRAEINSNCRIHPQAKLEGPVLIGEGCVIAKGAEVKGPAVLGHHCKVGEDATIAGAVLWHDAKVGKKAILRNCIIASGCDIQERSQVLDNCVLGDNVVVGRNSKLSNGIKVWPDKSIDADTVSA
jgi:mannose-1-phosphate guanylyltransferase